VEYRDGKLTKKIMKKISEFFGEAWILKTVGWWGMGIGIDAWWHNQAFAGSVSSITGVGRRETFILASWRAAIRPTRAVIPTAVIQRSSSAARLYRTSSAWAAG
jgi:hypothetical protein